MALRDQDEGTGEPKGVLSGEENINAIVMPAWDQLIKKSIIDILAGYHTSCILVGVSHRNLVE
jgi:hypothetical protein